MNSSFYSKLKYLSILCVLALLSACAGGTLKESSIEDRVAARWEKVLSGDYAGAYEFLSPGYRSSVSSIQYQRSLLLKRVRWTDAKYLESDCDESSCKVKISLGYRVAGAIPGVKAYDGKQKVVETWVMIDGTWYLVL